jgi:hypothetical protein
MMLGTTNIKHTPGSSNTNTVSDTRLHVDPRCTKLWLCTQSALAIYAHRRLARIQLRPRRRCGYITRTDWVQGHRSVPQGPRKRRSLIRWCVWNHLTWLSSREDIYWIPTPWELQELTRYRRWLHQEACDTTTWSRHEKWKHIFICGLFNGTISSFDDAWSHKW